MRGARPNRVTEREDDASELIGICSCQQDSFGKSSGWLFVLDVFMHAVAKYHNNATLGVD
jgi:hypothetical protein